jgi:hypothetical protein
MKKFTYLLFSFLVIGILFSCNCKKKTVSKTDATMQNKEQNLDNKINHKVLLKESNSNIKEEKNVVITNLDELKAVYSKINMTRRPGLPLPKVNFDTETVIGIFLGEKTHTGFNIVIDKIENKDKETVVQYKVETPKGKVAYVITQPALLVSIPKSEYPVKFHLLKE